MSAPHDPISSDGEPEPPSWLGAATEFLDARFGLIRAEARDAGRIAAKRVAAAFVLAVGAALGWLLLLVGLIGLVAASRGDWTWYGVMLVVAGVHFVAAVIAFFVLRRPCPPAFPLSREELNKDRSWLERLKKNKP